MSEVLVTPSVFGIAALPAGLLFGGVVLTAVLVRKMASSLESRSRKAFEDAVKTLPQLSVDVLRPPSLVEHDARLRMKTLHSQVEGLHLPPADQMRVSAMLSLVAGPYVVEKPMALEQPLAALLSATTVAETHEAQKALTETVRAGHQQLFTRGLTHACAKACEKIGFSDVETTLGPLGEVRVIATDSKGRSLVAEVQKAKNGDPALAAEVVGVRDGSCHEILDAFEKALAVQGVRYTAPRRRSTGGVCQLQAARDFIGKRVGRKAEAKPALVGDSHDGQRRAQRLNQKKVQQAQ